MKKLMIAAAIVCAAALSQAAQIKWSAANIYEPVTTGTSATRLSGATAYLFDAATVSQSALFTAAQGADFDISKAGAINSIGISNGSANATTTAFEYGDVSTQYSFYVATLVDDAIYFSQVVTQTTAAGATQPNTWAFANQANGETTFSNKPIMTDGTAHAGYWNSVPEPTSGLLLLLGVAGLALRRRRA